MTIPNSVTSIGEYAFYNCTALTTATIGESVSRIESQAFASCRQLTNVYCLAENVPNTNTDVFNNFLIKNATLHVPSASVDSYKSTSPWSSFKEVVGIKTVGNIEFADANVKAICVANWDTNGDGELSYDEAAAVKDLGTVFKSNHSIKSFNELQYFAGLSSIGKEAFWFCIYLKSFTIPNSVTSIEQSAFNQCRSLTNVIIPNSVISIGDRAFWLCRSLTSITIPNSVTSIGMYAISDCGNLASLTIPSSVTHIGQGAFRGCSGLTSVTIPSSVTSIEWGAFAGCSSLTSITVEAGNSFYDSRDGCNAIIKTADNNLIAGCKNTVIPNSVTSIGAGAFMGCNGLTSITIPSSVTGILEYAFQGCSSLTSVTLPSSVNGIGYYSFQNCSGLTSVTIPNSVTRIYGSAFQDCNKLTSVTAEMETPVVIEENTFSNRANATLYVPAGCKAAYEEADYWKEFKEIVEMAADDPTIPTDGLVAYYPFNGNANDESGNGNNGTVIGHVELAPDRFGNVNSAYRFFGEPLNYISVPDNESLHCSVFTLNGWAYSDAEDYGSGVLVNKGRDISNGSYRLTVRSVGASNLYGGVNDAMVEEYPTTNAWHMVTGTVEGNKARFYLDGVLMDEATLSNPFEYSNTEPLALGMHYYDGVPSSWAYAFLGVLDDVRIYNRVLTQSEITALYNEQKPNTEVELSYDVDNDGGVDNDDVNSLVDKILDCVNDIDDTDYTYDVNNDGKIDITDVTLVVDRIAYLKRLKTLETGSADEVRTTLEEMSGKSQADASEVASVLQTNVNVEEASTVDGDNVILKMKDSNTRIVYPLYADYQIFSEDALPEIRKSPARVMMRGRYQGDVYRGTVAIFNHFEGKRNYNVQNRVVGYL